MDVELKSAFNMFNFIYIVNRYFNSLLFSVFFIFRNNFQVKLFLIFCVSDETYRYFRSIFYLVWAWYFFATELLFKTVFQNKLIFELLNHIWKSTIFIGSIQDIPTQLLYGRIFPLNYIL